MSNYQNHGVDQYMRSVLTDELSIDEADNVLTALSTLTAVYPGLFPHERTFARPDHQPDVTGPAGVRFVVYGDEGIIRTLRLPRSVLASLRGTIDEVFTVLDAFNVAAA